MTSLAAVVGLVTVVALAAVAAFAALATFSATGFTAFVTVAAFASLAAFTAVAAFAAGAVFAAGAATAFAFTPFSATGFTAFASRSAFVGFFAGAFVGETTAFAMNARRFVLVEAGTACPAASSTRQCERAARAQHEKSSGQHRRETLCYEGSPGCRGGPASGAHSPQLHSVECKRVKRRALVAKHVCDVAQVIGEAFVFR